MFRQRTLICGRTERPFAPSNFTPEKFDENVKRWMEIYSETLR
jgi:hypothetical protein